MEIIIIATTILISVVIMTMFLRYCYKEIENFINFINKINSQEEKEIIKTLVKEIFSIKQETQKEIKQIITELYKNNKKDSNV